MVAPRQEGVGSPGLPRPAFSLPNAVASFSRWSRLAEAICRRLLAILFSMYFDDGTLQDWRSSAVKAQASLSELMVLMGFPWAEAKTQRCSSEGDFLGLEHDVGKAHKGVLTFWPMLMLIEKAEHILESAKICGLFSGVAAKLFGLTSFLEGGLLGRVGRAGLEAIRERRHDHSTHHNTPSILRPFSLLHDLLSMKP